MKKENVFVTIMDCDIWAPKSYVYELIDVIERNSNKKNKLLVLNSQITGRNEKGISTFITVNDDCASLSNWNTQPLIPGALNLCISCYCLSYQLLEEIDFWETTPDAIS